jgi:hypothetical protein
MQVRGVPVGYRGLQITTDGEGALVGGCLAPLLLPLWLEAATKCVPRAAVKGDVLSRAHIISHCWLGPV